MRMIHIIRIPLMCASIILLASGLHAEPPTQEAPAPTPSQAEKPVAPSALQIVSPIERSIVQRDQRNMGKVLVRCTTSGDSVEVKVVEKSSLKTALDWTALKADRDSFSKSLELPAGWYAVEFQAKQGGTVVKTGTVQRVGVGDVFVTAGQSNSANYGQPRQAAKADCVSSCDVRTGQWHHGDDPQRGASGGGGSPWPLLGDLLTQKTGLPVGFICVGVGSTRVEQWAPTGDCYGRLKAALELTGPKGCRAVLWHQGESNSIAGTPAEVYAQTLAHAITQSRKEAGWQVPWGVAIASFHPAVQATAERQQAIVAGQKQVIKGLPQVFQGPTTDGFQARGFLADTVHFNAEGLACHAQGWFEAITARFPKL